MIATWTAWRDRVFTAIRRDWISPLLVVGLVSWLIYAVEKAAWVRDPFPIQASLPGGLLLGWLLARTRWNGLAATAYSLVMGIASLAEGVGDLFPSLRDLLAQPVAASLDQIRVQTTALGLRVGGWVTLLQQGEAVRDTGLFVLAAGFAAWTAGVWLAWWLIRRRQALPALAPLLFWAAVNNHLSRQGTWQVAGFFALAVMLAAWGAYMRARAGWERRRLDYSEDLGLEWGSAGLGLAIGVSGFGLILALVATPQGWQALSDWVRPGRAQMADAAARLFANVNPPRVDDTLEIEPVIRTPNLGQIGAPLPLSNATVFWVSTDDPAPPPPQVQAGLPVSVERHVWRSQVFDVYTGRGWEPAALEASGEPPQAGPEAPPGRRKLEQRFTIVAEHSGLLFAASQPVSTAGEGAVLRRVAGEDTWLVEGETSAYSVSSMVPAATVEMLRAAGTEYPSGLFERYTQLPITLPERVRTLAKEIVLGAETPYDRAVQIQDMLRRTYRYDLTVGPPAADRDVVDVFLFDSRSGFCSHFSSAMVVMLRAVGVPARVAAGYAMGSYDVEKQAWNVPASASHAWVEVFFPGLGWVEFEPTLAYGPFDRPQSRSEPEAARASQPPAQEASRANGWLAGVILLGVPAGLWTAFLLSRRVRARRSDQIAKAAALYRRVCAGLRVAGEPLRIGQTPGEFARETNGRLLNYPRLRLALQAVTKVVEQAHYHRIPPASQEVEQAGRLWRSASGEWLLLVWRRRVLGQ